MKVSDIAVKNAIVVDEEDSIAKALMKMKENRVHQLPVASEDSVVGMLVLKHLLGRDYDPSRTPVKSYMVKAPHLTPRMSLDDAILQITQSGLRALPVLDEGNIVGIVSETDLIKRVEFVRDIDPRRLMSSVVTILESDNIDKAMSLMNDHNVSRLAVVNSGEKLLGCLDAFGLISFLSYPRESPRYSEVTSKEKESLRAFKVKDEMRKTFGLDEEEFSLKKVISALQKNEEVIVTKSEKPFGVIVPKDVLELANLEHQYPVYVAHLKGVEQFELTKFQDMLSKFMERFEKMVSIQKFFVYGDVHKQKEGGRTKFSLRGKVLTDKKVYIAKSYGWDLKEAAHILLDNLERQLVRNHEKSMGKAKRRLKI